MGAVERRPREPVALARREHHLERVAEGGRIEASSSANTSLPTVSLNFSSFFTLGPPLPASFINRSGHCPELRRGDPAGRLGLGAKRDLGDLERVRLGHGGLAAFDDVPQQRRCEGKRLIAAVEVTRALAVHQEEVVSPFAPGGVAVLSHLDRAFAARMKRRPSPQCPARPVCTSRPARSR